ncbi:glycosyltransferase family 9 protein [Falsiroseomonas sp.]|uniref:glycosyltransferase family 9 protein n=1 Tax=Falsiroseomonas sp. TaxID=2870721 RepID=UPI002726861B|nr:glycosyltransferase family 9 protein [Falsiroseomonas sp.]MDO9503415.1 glycosyltransferase family 9 protein [Falsiroseomonas sp.]
MSGGTAIIQPLPGVGDMVWHLPHIHALAEALGEPVTIITKPRSRADQIFAGDPSVRRVIWLDRAQSEKAGRHDGWLGAIRLGLLLRRERFKRVYILHHSWRYAFAAWLAGVPERYGYGFGRQRTYLNRGPFLDKKLRRAHPVQLADAYLDAAAIPRTEIEPVLRLDADAVTTKRALYADRLRPWIGIGLGSSEAYKQWGAENFAVLIAGLAADGWGSFFLLGGPAEAGFMPAIHAAMRGNEGRLIETFEQPIGDILPVLGALDLYVGNDTGFLNLAAAAGIPAVGLFGATPPLTHSTAITALLPPDGKADKATGMSRITVDSVRSAISSSKRLPDEVGHV